MSATHSRYLDPSDAALRAVVRRIVETVVQVTPDPAAFRGHFLRLCIADLEAGDFDPDDGGDPEDARTAAIVALSEFLGPP